MTTIQKILLCLFVILNISQAKAQDTFEQWFEDKALRIDFVLTGNHEGETFVLKQLKQQEYWAGTLQVSDKEATMGNYRFSIYDSTSNKLLYSQGFCSLFQEWQSTAEAKKRYESYYHVNLAPFPKQTVKYKLEKRAYNDGKFHELASVYINPNNYFILKEEPTQYKVDKIANNGNHHKKADIAFIAEGYSKKEMKVFKKDAMRIWEYISSISPFSENKNNFNVWAIESISEESGTDNPGAREYYNTIANSTFYTFDIERYLTTKDLKSLHDIAALTPADHIFVLVNTEKYGGGGFYNYYSLTSAHNDFTLKVAIHEFGHGFAGLADEYYNSSVAYEDFYNLEVEPWEPNITTLVDFASKWVNMIPKGTPMPTPREKKYNETVGVFEGGGYMSKGVYSPYMDCRMKSNIPKGFCPVCEKGIQEAINQYLGE